jgi:hypothetical protein
MDMGKHSPPVDGIPVANGHAPVSALVPFDIHSLQVRPSGPMSRWPQPGKTERLRRAMSAHRGWLAAVPVVLVNAVAFAGQLAFLRTHLPWPSAGQVLVAVTLESVAVYLAWQAHLALAADDSALRLRLAAYGFAAVIGVMNYSHYMAAHWRPTFAAVTFGLMSVSSPWLWSVHSRRASRDALKAKGLIEPHAVRLGATRWTWHPWRSAKVMWHATWLGENDPAKAIALAEPVQPDVPPPPAAAPDKEPDKTLDIEAGQQQDIPASAGVDKPQAIRARKTVTGLDKAADILRRNPDLTNAEVAKRAHVSEKTVSRARTVIGAS